MLKGTKHNGLGRSLSNSQVDCIGQCNIPVIGTPWATAYFSNYSALNIRKPVALSFYEMPSEALWWLPTGNDPIQTARESKEKEQGASVVKYSWQYNTCSLLCCIVRKNTCRNRESTAAEVPASRSFISFSPLVYRCNLMVPTTRMVCSCSHSRTVEVCDGSWYFW